MPESEEGRGLRPLQFQRVGKIHWRVTAESESGATIGFVDFTVVKGEAEKLKTLRL
jgi:hypothetical protein